jgi:hypothetical protein
MSQPWPRDSNETASDQPGAVHRDGNRERAEVANHIHAQRTPLQMSHEASPILDFIRSVGGLIVVKLDRMGGTPPGTFSTSCTNW